MLTASYDEIMRGFNQRYLKNVSIKYIHNSNIKKKTRIFFDLISNRMDQEGEKNASRTI